MDDDQGWQVPWLQVGLAAGIGLVGLVLALAVLAPLVVLGVLLWLALVGAAGWFLGRRVWKRTVTAPRQAPSTTEVEAIAERHRLAAGARHARTQEVVDAGLVPPGFVRPDSG